MPRNRLLAAAAACALLGFAPSAQGHGPHPAPAADKASAPARSSDRGRSWLAGDHHVHSRFSATYPANPDDPTAAPVPVLSGEGWYAITKNAAMARQHGLSWMVSTDHGGPNHSKLNYEQAYPELLQARVEVPGLLLFYGMEFDTPAGDHSSLIIPRTDAEREVLRDLEFEFAKRETFPRDPARDTEPKMIEALRHMLGLAAPPVVIANHPARSASAVGSYGQYRPGEFRNWNDTAPNIAVGMEGAPGHQAAALGRSGAIERQGARGAYGGSPTMGGFDQMTARLGGFWDSMLGEGRRWWISADSDSHRHYSEGGSDFWPGEYAKTYVRARRDHADILDGLRNGRSFVTTGDLVSELDVTAAANGRQALIGGVLAVRQGRDVRLTIRIRDPAGQNFGGRSPSVARVDLIMGEVTGQRADREGDTNPSTRVVRRFTAADWRRNGEVLTITHVLKDVANDAYIRLRGTNTADLEPGPDPRGEDPWSDLWFYSNPIFLEVGG